MLGLSSAHNVADDLEKRVLSRVGRRRVLVTFPAPPDPAADEVGTRRARTGSVKDVLVCERSWSFSSKDTAAGRKWEGRGRGCGGVGERSRAHEREPRVEGQGVRVKREKPCEASGKHGNGNASACT